MEIDFNKPVRFIDPLNEFEKTAEYIVKSYSDVTGRVMIQHICDLPIKPIETVSINDIENV